MFFQPGSNFCPVGFPTSLILVSESIALALTLPIVYWGLIYLMIKAGLFLKSRVTKLLLTVSLFISSCLSVEENISPVINWNEMDAKRKPQKELCYSLSQHTELPVFNVRAEYSDAFWVKQDEMYVPIFRNNWFWSLSMEVI